MGNKEILVSIIIFLAVQTLPSSLGQDTCSLEGKPWNPTAQARFGLSVSLRKPGNPGNCEMVSQEALQLYVAAQWVCEKLNEDTGNGSYVPGIQFGFDLLDDCRSPTKAVRQALEYVNTYSSCSAFNSSSSQLGLGIVGPTRSSTAEATADTLKSIKVPIISPAATLASLTEDSTRYPNFFRTVPSDKIQIKTMVAILKMMNWTYFALIYTADNYGQMGSQLLREEAARSHLCIGINLVINSTTNLNNIFRDLQSTLRNTKHGSLAVVFIGGKDKAENLLFEFRKESMALHFIMSDSVGINTDVFDSAGPNALGTITLAPSNVLLRDFQTYLNDKYRAVRQGTETNDIISSYLRSNGNLGTVQQVSFVPLAVSAIFALATALREAHRSLCQGVEGVCLALLKAVREDEILKRLSVTEVNFGNMDDAVAPREFKESGYIFEFDDTGDIVTNGVFPEYAIFAFENQSSQGPYKQIGNYSTGSLVLNTSGMRKFTTPGQVTTSECKEKCLQCAQKGKIPMAHLSGSAYIMGIFSLHNNNDDKPFECDNFRKVSMDAIVLEAFLHSVERMKHSTDLDLGVVAFDDCYSVLHITSILSDFMSGLGPNDKNLFPVSVPQEKLVGLIGALSSDSTIAVTSFCTQLRLPSISYSASSPDLDDLVNFPYFLRTVPSDEEQAIAIAEVIIAMNWSYVGLLYVKNNYGTKGAFTFQRVAGERGICVADPVPISVSSSKVDRNDLYGSFIKLLQQSVKVVVFFGIDTRMADFLRVIESENQQGRFIFIASEEWGTKMDVLEEGKRAGRGSLTFKVDNIYLDGDTEMSLRTRLLEKTPSSEDINPWFSEFWQHLFDCNIPGGFNNIFDRDCDPNQKLTSQQVDRMLTDQRVKHVMNAVKAMANGLAEAKTFCADGFLFPCDFMRSATYAPKVYDLIRSQTATVGNQKVPMFDDKGNGNIGFSIYNIQHIEGKNYTYKNVGTYTRKDGLLLKKKDMVFYKDTGLPLDHWESPCIDECLISCKKPSDVLPTLSPNVNADSEFRVADVVNLVVPVCICLLLICIMILGFNYFRRKVRGLSKELQEQKTEHVYQHVMHTPPPVMYGNMDTAQRVASLPAVRPIHFVNGLNSGANSPGNTLDGRTNPAFLSDGTLNMTSPQSENNPYPLNRPPALPPLPTLPNSSSTPQFHHSISAGPRLQRDRHYSNRSSQHKYYMAHSLSSSRELPAIPGTANGIISPSRTSQGQDRREQIPLQNLSPQSNHLNRSPQYGDPFYLFHSDPDSEGSHEGFVQNNAERNDPIQYFRMDNSGQLQEDEDEEELSTVNTYSLSQSGEELTSLNTHSHSPQTSQSAQYRDNSPVNQMRDSVQYDRSENLPSTCYSGVRSPRECAEAMPASAYSGMIPFHQITPEMQDILLQQLLVDSILAQQQGLNDPSGGSRPWIQNPAVSNMETSSQVPATARSSQRSIAGYQQSRRQSSKSLQSPYSGTYPAPEQSRQPYPYPDQQPAHLNRSPPYEQKAPNDFTTLYNKGASTQGGSAQIPPHPMTSQFTSIAGMPQTELPSPYAQQASNTSQQPREGTVSAEGGRRSPTDVQTTEMEQMSSADRSSPESLQELEERRGSHSEVPSSLAQQQQLQNLHQNQKPLSEEDGKVLSAFDKPLIVTNV